MIVIFIENHMGEYWNISQADSLECVQLEHGKETNWFLIAKYGDTIACLKEYRTKKRTEEFRLNILNQYSGFFHDTDGKCWNLKKALKIECLPKKMFGELMWCIAATFERYGTKYFLPNQFERNADQQLKVVLKKIGNDVIDF